MPLRSWRSSLFASPSSRMRRAAGWASGQTIKPTVGLTPVDFCPSLTRLKLKGRASVCASNSSTRPLVTNTTLAALAHRASRDAVLDRHRLPRLEGFQPNTVATAAFRLAIGSVQPGLSSHQQTESRTLARLASRPPVNFVTGPGQSACNRATQVTPSQQHKAKSCINCTISP